MTQPKPQVSMKSAARLLGFTEDQLRGLTKAGKLPAYSMSVDGWTKTSGKGSSKFFDLYDLKALGAEHQANWPALSEIIPNMGASAAAQELGFSTVSLWNRVKKGDIEAYVLNEDETGWVHYGSPNASSASSLFFVKSDIEAYASSIDPDYLRRRQSGKTGNIPRKTPRTRITVPVPQIYEEYLPKTNRVDWIVEAIKMRLVTEGKIQE